MKKLLITAALVLGSLAYAEDYPAPALGGEIVALAARFPNGHKVTWAIYFGPTAWGMCTDASMSFNSAAIGNGNGTRYYCVSKFDFAKAEREAPPKKVAQW